MNSKVPLIQDYLKRAQKRLLMLQYLMELEDYPDVVREAQEVVELLLKALIMSVGLEVPKVHDLSKFLEKHESFFPKVIRENIETIKKISRNLRKERELSFYGALDWIPSEEYTLNEAEQALNWAKLIYQWVSSACEELLNS